MDTVQNGEGGRAKFSFPLRFFLVFAGVIILDQLTKLLIMHFLPIPASGIPVYDLDGAVKPVSVIDGFFYIVHITNRGAAWGILSGQTFLLTGIALVVLFATWIFRHHMGFQYPQMQYAMGLFCGGIIGNLVDRICYGHVVDFLDVHLPFVNYRWPAFNVADCAIFVGCAMYIVISLLLEHREKNEMKSGANKAKGSSE